MMSVSLRVGTCPTSIFNVYAPVCGTRWTNVWLDKQLIPVLLENAAKGWAAIVGGDFNSKLSILDGFYQANLF